MENKKLTRKTEVNRLFSAFDYTVFFNAAQTQMQFFPMPLNNKIVIKCWWQ